MVELEVFCPYVEGAQTFGMRVAIKYGDANTKWCHSCVNSRRVHAFVNQLLHELGNFFAQIWLKFRTLIICCYFEELFSARFEPDVEDSIRLV